MLKSAEVSCCCPKSPVPPRPSHQRPKPWPRTKVITRGRLFSRAGIKDLPRKEQQYPVLICSIPHQLGRHPDFGVSCQDRSGPVNPVPQPTNQRDLHTAERDARLQGGPRDEKGRLQCQVHTRPQLWFTGLYFDKIEILYF